tara:strand:- start:2684 stop:3664 length:981 start_codon:yes stop_codon:yes gene_type:complete
MPTALITGGHAGLGLACSNDLASVYGMDLILAGRSLERITPVAEQIRKAHGVKVAPLLLDISSLASVRDAAARLRQMRTRGDIGALDAVLLNAGGQFRGPISYSVDGYEETFATNCLGHFLLLELMADLVAPEGRIVFTASGTHDPDTADGRMVGKAAAPDARALAFDGKNGAKPLSGGIRYSTSKLCTILYAYELHRRLRARGSKVSSIAFDPGSIPETGLLRTMPKPVQWLARSAPMKALMRRMGVTEGSIGFSGGALAKVAADPAFAQASGKYLQSTSGRLIEKTSSAASHDEGAAARLWRDSEDLVHLRSDERSDLLAAAWG